MINSNPTNDRDSAGRAFAQPRDDHGRFLGYNKKHNRRYTLIELKEAFRSGLNAQYSILPPSKQLELYLKKMGYEDE